MRVVPLQNLLGMKNVGFGLSAGSSSCATWPQAAGWFGAGSCTSSQAGSPPLRFQGFYLIIFCKAWIRKPSNNSTQKQHWWFHWCFNLNDNVVCSSVLHHENEMKHLSVSNWFKEVVQKSSFTFCSSLGLLGCVGESTGSACRSILLRCSVSGSARWDVRG